jgi:hypothetical protein
VVHALIVGLKIMKRISSAVIACFALVPLLLCHGSVSNPPEISVKEGAEVGTTSDPSVRLLATHIFVPSMPDDKQIVRLELFIDATTTVDRTTLFVIDPSNDLIAETNLKGSRDKNEFHYTIYLKKPFLKMSTVHVVFKDGKTKRLLLGTTQLPISGEQAGTGQPATRSEADSEGSDKPQPDAEGRSR